MKILDDIGSFLGITQNVQMFRDIGESIATGKNHMTTNDWITLGGDIMIVAVSIATAGVGGAAADEAVAGAEVAGEHAAEEGGERATIDEGSRLSGSLHWRDTGLEEDVEKDIVPTVRSEVKPALKAVNKEGEAVASKGWMRQKINTFKSWIQESAERGRIQNVMDTIGPEKKELLEAIQRDDDPEEIESISKDLDAKLYRMVKKSDLPKGKGDALDALRARWENGQKIVNDVRPRSWDVKPTGRFVEAYDRSMNVFTRSSERFDDAIRPYKPIIKPLFITHMTVTLEASLEKVVKNPAPLSFLQFGQDVESFGENVGVGLIEDPVS